MIIGSHQPDFAPWVGFFVKGQLSDVFNIELNDLTNKRYSSRVMIDSRTNTWLNLPLSTKTQRPYNETVVDLPRVPKVIDKLTGYLSNLKVHKPNIKLCADLIYDSRSVVLSEFNLNLIQNIVNLFKIKPNIVITSTPYTEHSSAEIRVMQSITNLELDTRDLVYLSGPGFLNYKTDKFIYNYKILKISSRLEILASSILLWIAYGYTSFDDILDELTIEYLN